MVTIPHRNHGVCDLIKNVSLDRLLLETDAPYLKPTTAPDYELTQPGHVFYQALAVADLLQLPVTEVCNRTFENTKKVYKLPL